jgi:hypothetical protein
MGMYEFIGLKGCNTYAFNNCNTNLLSGLKQRYGKEPPLQNAKIYNEIRNSFIKVFKRRKDFFLGDTFKTNRSKWLSRYDLKQRLKLKNALKYVPSKKKQFESEIFVKWENNIMIDELFNPLSCEVGKDLKPRIIFKRNDYNLNKNGPVLYECKSRLANYYDGNNNSIKYVAKETPASIGKFLASKLGVDLAGYWCVEADLQMCETTMTGYLQEVQAQQMANMNVPIKKIKYLLDHEVSYGRAMGKNEVKFKFRKSRESGTADTSYGNTEVYATCLEVLLHHFHLENDVLVLISGDDCLMFVKNIIPRDTILHLYQYLHALGLKPEPLFHKNPYKGTFFSGRFLPVLNTLGKETLILTPKIGRFLAKGFTIKKNMGFDPLHIAFDMFRSRVESEYPHVPIINKACMAFFQLLEKPKQLKLPINYKKDYSYFWGRKMKNGNIYQSYHKTYSALANIYELELGSIMECEEYVTKAISNHHFKSKLILESFTLDIIAHVDN